MTEENSRSRLVRQWRALLAATRDPRLSRTDCAVMGAVLDRMDDTGASWPSYETIAADAGIARSSAAEGVRRCKVIGHLVVEEGGRNRSNVYRLGTPNSPDPERADSPESRTVDSPELRTVNSPESRTATVRNSGLQIVRDPGPEPASLNLLQEPEELSLTSLAPADRFSEFWTAYPRKVGDGKKLRATWKARNLDAEAEKIIGNVRERVAHDRQWRDKQFIPHPTTFINQSRWLDDWVRVGTERPGSSFRTSVPEDDEDARIARIEAATRIATGGDR